MTTEQQLIAALKEAVAAIERHNEEADYPALRTSRKHSDG